MNDGGQAFPRPGYDGPDSGEASETGMTLRDWFAGQALAGFEIPSACKDDLTHIDGEFYAGLARYSYACADAMLAERERVK